MDFSCKDFFWNVPKCVSRVCIPVYSMWTLTVLYMASGADVNPPSFVSWFWNGMYSLSTSRVKIQTLHRLLWRHMISYLLTSKVTIFQKGVTMNFSVTSKMHLTSWGGWYSKDMTFVIPTKDMNDIAIVVQIHLRRNWLLVLLFLQQNPPSSTTTRIIPKRRDPSETKMTMTWWHKSLVIILPREKKKDSDFILLVTYWKCERNVNYM